MAEAVRRIEASEGCGMTALETFYDTIAEYDRLNDQLDQIAAEVERLLERKAIQHADIDAQKNVRIFSVIEG